MKNKLVRVFLALIVALPMFTSVLAISKDQLLDRLDSIKGDIDAIVKEYKEEVELYPDVIAALSAEGKQTVEDLSDGLILADGMKTRLDALKTELEALEVEDADKLLSSTKAVEDEFKALVEDNKDVIEDVKANYSDLTLEEIKEVAKEATEVIKSLGASTDVDDTYNDMMKILEEAHGLALDISMRLESIIPNHVATFESALTKELVKELLTEVKAKDQEAVIDTLIEALDNAQGGKDLKVHLTEVKNIAVDLKNKLKELNTLDEMDLIMFSDSQKADVADKIKAVEKDYIDFAKTVLDACAEDYMEVVINLAYDETVDQMIEYANEALDLYDEYKDTVKSLTAKDLMDKLNLPEELEAKAGIMVALGFVDTTDYNKEYINKNFGTQIENISKYLATEILDYIDHIDSTLNDEVMDVYNAGSNHVAIQKELRGITAARFTTIENITALKTRVETDLIADDAETKADLAKLVGYVYDVYHENILLSTSATLMKENDKADRKYECNTMSGVILTDTFMATSEFTKEVGIPEKYSSVISYENAVKGKVKTGTMFVMTLSDTHIGTCGFAVLGDTYADGQIDARDYMAIKNEIMKGNALNQIALLAADTYRDKLVDARDYMVIKNEIMKGNAISL